MQMRWTDLLFAHWPVSAEQVAARLPPGLAVDTFDQTAWIGIVPFRMEQVRLRGAPVLPGHRHFLEMNVRTYVRDLRSGHAGVYFFSLDASNALAVWAARAWYRLPYYLARMQVQPYGRALRYDSCRLFSARRADLRVEYQRAGFDRALPPSRPGTLAHFLTERYALFTELGEQIVRADIQHRPWILEPAEAEFRDLSVASAEGFPLLSGAPLLHFSEVQDMLAWLPKTQPA
jgi:uncharacterized protein YqjF (DUF2071 family)